MVTMEYRYLPEMQPATTQTCLRINIHWNNTPVSYIFSPDNSTGAKLCFKRNDNDN